MTDLQTALDHWDDIKGFIWQDIPTDDLEAIRIGMDVARLVANPNISQIAQWLHSQRIRGVKCYESFPEECTCMADVEAIAAALTRGDKQ